MEGGNQGGQAGNAPVSPVAGEGKSGCSEGELRDQGPDVSRDQGREEQWPFFCHKLTFPETGRACQEGRVRLKDRKEGA